MKPPEERFFLPRREAWRSYPAMWCWHPLQMIYAGWEIRGWVGPR